MVPLKLMEHVEKVNVVLSEPLTAFRPPSPLFVLPPWFLRRIAYFTFSYLKKMQIHKDVLVKITLNLLL